MKSNQRNQIFISTFSSNAEKTAANYGFGLELDDLCISSNLDSEKREWVIERMKGEMERAGITRDKAIIHGPFTELTPAAIDRRFIQLMKSRYIETISICRELGVPRLVLHDGYIPLLYQKPWHMKKSIEFWTEFYEDIPEGFTVYLENVFDDEPELLREIVERVNENLGLEKGEEAYLICLDVGHANAMIPKNVGGSSNSTDEIIRWIKHMGNLIGHVHLHNNDGSSDAHDHIMNGAFDIDRVLDALMEYGRCDLSLTVESREAELSCQYLFEKLIDNK